jgi:serine/threonine protein kinase
MDNRGIPGFELVRLLGAGGFGSVWLARQPSVDREVAVKIGHQPLTDDVARVRFDRECRALGRLSGNSSIVTVHVAGTLADGRPYLVMEYVSGGTLWSRVQREPVPAGELATIGAQLCDALQHAHRHDILHRDIKPENVLIREGGSIVLGDFGIAALRDGAATTSAAITATVPFSAPEVLSGSKASAASDLYAIGATILAAATRAVPFTTAADEGVAAILHRIFTTDPPDLRTHGYPDELATIVERLMARDPATRPGSAEEVGALFRAVASDRSEPDRPSRPGGTTVVANPLAPRPHSGDGTGDGSPPSPSWPSGSAAPTPATVPAPSPPTTAPAGIPSAHHTTSPATPASDSSSPGQPGDPVEAGPHTWSGPQIPGSIGPHQAVAVARNRPTDPGAHRVALLTLAAVVVVIAAGFGTYLMVRSPTDGTTTSPSGDLAGPGDLPGTAEDPTTAPASSTTAPASSTTAPASSTTAPTTTIGLGPIGVPLSTTDAGLPESATVEEFVADPDDHGFCNIAIDLTGLVEQQSVSINHSGGNDQITQAAGRFDDETAADAYLAAITDSLVCSSWNDVTIDGSQSYTSRAVLIEPARRFGDDVLAWQTAITFENGFVVTQRGYLVRRLDRVVGVSYTTDEPARTDQVPDLVTLMLDRLGYGT